MKRIGLSVLALLLLAVWTLPAAAYHCPVAIKEAKEAVAKAETAAAKAPADKKGEVESLLKDAKKLIAEAESDHSGAKSLKGHADSVRKAETAKLMAVEADVLLRGRP